MGAPNFFLSVVVPVYNEKEALPDFIEAFREAAREYRKSFELVFVDDGSTDGSGELLKELCKNLKNCKVVTLAQNYGREAALCAGFKYSEGKYAGILSADLQYSPSELFRLADSVHPDFPDLLAGIVSAKSYRENTTVRKAEAVRLSIACAGRLTDPLCSLRVYSRRLIQRAQRVSGNSFLPTTLLPRIARSLKEIEVLRNPRKKGQQTLKRGAEALPEPAKEQWNQLSMLSLGGATAGVVIAISAIIIALKIGGSLEELTGRLSLAVALLGVIPGAGLVLFSLAFKKLSAAFLPVLPPVRYYQEEVASFTNQQKPPRQRNTRRDNNSRNDRGDSRRPRRNDNRGKSIDDFDEDLSFSSYDDIPVVNTKGAPVTFEDVVHLDSSSSKDTKREEKPQPRRKQISENKGNGQGNQKKNEVQDSVLVSNSNDSKQCSNGRNSGRKQTRGSASRSTKSAVVNSFDEVKPQPKPKKPVEEKPRETPAQRPPSHTGELEWITYPRKRTRKPVQHKVEKPAEEIAEPAQKKEAASKPEPKVKDTAPSTSDRTPLEFEKSEPLHKEFHETKVEKTTEDLQRKVFEDDFFQPTPMRSPEPESFEEKPVDNSQGTASEADILAERLRKQREARARQGKPERSPDEKGTSRTGRTARTSRNEDSSQPKSTEDSPSISSQGDDDVDFI